MNPTSPKIIDIFAGAGGLSLGAARAGFDVVGAIEKDAKASEIHEKNFSQCQMLGDVVDLSGRDILDHLDVSTIDGIIGGPPCQGFSTMGRRSKNDSRNDLFLKFFQLVAEIRPKFFLAENVPGIMHNDYRKIRDRALNLVSDYTVLPPLKLKASDFGAPTTRTRMFFIGFRREECDAFDSESINQNKSVSQVTVEQALFGLPKKVPPHWNTESQSWRVVRRYSNTTFADSIRNAVPVGVGDSQAIGRLESENRVSGFLGTAHTPEVVRRFDSLEIGQKDGPSKAIRLDPSGYCPTLRAGTGSDRGSFQAVRPIHPTEPRVITPREAARLQGFPDWFVFHPTKWHSFRQIGNSVSPLLAESVMRAILKSLHHQA